MPAAGGDGRQRLIDSVDMGTRETPTTQYDWSNGGYVLVAAPSRAIQRPGLNEDLKLIADLAVFKSIDFSQHVIVSVGSMTEVIQPGM